MNTHSSSTRPKSPHHVLIRSNPFSTETIWDVITLLDALVSGDNPEVAQRHRFQNRDQVVDSTDAFCGAFLQPVSLTHFSEDSDSDVIFVRYSEWLDSPRKLAIEIEESINEAKQWIDHGFDLSSTISYSVSDAVFLGIERLSQLDHWRCWTQPFNDAIRRGEVSALAQKQRLDELIRCLGAPFGQKEYRLEIVDGYLEYEGGRDARLTLRDLFLGFGDHRIHQRLEIQLLDEETPLLVRGLTSYFNQLAMGGRVVNRMYAYRENYENWRRYFTHRQGFYQYLYLGVLADSVIAYFTCDSSKPPVGFVPFADYWVIGPSRGSVSLSFEFSHDDVRLWISGGETLSEEGMHRFLEVTGLVEFADESCVVFR